MSNHRLIGLALGGGGARGLAHIGILKALDRADIPINVVAGTSMGGIVGALYAAGMSPNEIEASIQASIGSITDLLALVDLRISRNGLLKGNRVYDLVAGQLGPQRTFASLRRPFAVVAVDTVTGREVVLDQGWVADAVRATMSVPGIFAPVEMGAYRLVDGGLLNNVPVDVTRQLGADFVIAVDVLPNFGVNRPGQQPTVPRLSARFMPRAYRDLWHIEMIMISALTEYRLRDNPPDVLLRPELPPDMDVLVGFDRPEVAIAAGELAVEAALSQIRARLEGRPEPMPEED
mgnify:CR=1 FL=1